MSDDRGRTKRLLLHLESTAVERGDHRLHKPVMCDVGVGALIWLCQEGRGRNPLGRKRVFDRRAMFDRELDPVQATVFRLLAESGEEVADRRTPLHNRPVGQIDLGVVGILR